MDVELNGTKRNQPMEMEETTYPMYWLCTTMPIVTFWNTNGLHHWHSYVVLPIEGNQDGNY